MASSTASIASREDRVRTFCTETSLHGFPELYKSKRKWQKGVWALMILISVSCMIVHEYEQFSHFLMGRNNLVSTTMQSDDYAFPRVYLDIPAWLWIDRRKLSRYNITYEQLVAAKSYLRPIDYYRSNVSVEDARRSLGEKFQEMNVADLISFFRKLQFDNNETGLSYEGKETNDTSVLIGQLVADDHGYLILNTSQYRQAMFRHSAMSKFVYNFDSLWQSAYDHMRSGDLGADYKENASAKSLLPRPGLLTEDILLTMLQPRYTYTVRYHLQVYARLPPCDNKYNGDLFYLVGNCQKACEIRINSTFNASSCYVHDLHTAFYVNYTSPCCKGVRVNGNLTNVQEPKYRSLNEDESSRWKEQLGKCRDKCLPACQQYDVSSTIVDSLTNWEEVQNQSSIHVIFPFGTSVIMYKEVPTYLWYDLLSDIGGLLGLWLGASLLSLFQVFYLCCCQNNKVGAS